MKKIRKRFFVVEENWPKKTNQIIPKYNLESHTKEQVSNTYISEFVGNSLIVRLNENEGIPISKKENKAIMLGITKVAHRRQIEQRGDEWIILGDETGQLREFIPGTKPRSRKSRMMWVAIPPKTSLPILSPEFHGKDYEQFHSELNEALEQLAEIRKVEKFIFTHEQGHIPLSLKESKSQSPHLMMWSNTLPLVLERLLQKIADSKVKIYIERVYPLEPGSHLWQHHFKTLN